MQDSEIVSRAKNFFSRYEYSPTDAESLASIYLIRIHARRAKKFLEADHVRFHLENLGVNVRLADDEILQLGPVKV